MNLRILAYHKGHPIVVGDPPVSFLKSNLLNKVSWVFIIDLNNYYLIPQDIVFYLLVV